MHDQPSRGPAEARAFIQASTAVAAPPLLPEIALHLATEVTPLWQATEAWLSARGLEPPFWAFAWAGGQAIARLLLDRPEIVRGKTVLDLASGSGLCAIAAARAGALRVAAVDRDPMAKEAIALNAAHNGVVVEAHAEDLLGQSRLPPWAEGAGVVLAGDVCYDAAMTEAVLPWLRARASEGARVLLGDPGRAYLPAEGLVEIARHRVPVIDDVESEREKWGVVYEVLATAPPPPSPGDRHTSRGASS
ncbi:class I SAM-dependent methyltransferase [Polyangium aurulentum]|uniref:class I SAM-dependent methyltransferase n=1 Tax=Polyangium aurulentum TaxID=2567896 RepID=UPI0010AE6AD2|nr:50S ribosomal protein L11 methyltransferase [Polyangium aurulentum]UQA60266.1 50S ribosomal protein L11 methyltransferase [Polyangium aurulentum]